MRMDFEGSGKRTWCDGDTFGRGEVEFYMGDARRSAEGYAR